MLVEGRNTQATETGKTLFPAAAARAKSKKPENLAAAVANLSEWLTHDRFNDYREALLDLIGIAATDTAVADELYDSFYRVMPFGAGGRRSKVGVGPNRMNPYIAAMTAQGDAEFILGEQAKKGTPVTAGDLFLGAWDVRAFHKYFAETPALERYREVIEANVLGNSICLLTDPDADRVGLGMQTFSISPNGKRARLHWVSANDNDESGIVLFRYRLEKMVELAERGELIRFIEERRLEDGNPAATGQRHQLVVVNTVVSNPLEEVIAERISRSIAEKTGGLVSVRMITHHVGFKFTGEIIANIKRGNAGLPFEGITGELMIKAGINGNEAFFVMSSEEGEGSLIGFRGSIDKDSGVTGLALAFLAAEQ